MNIFKIGDFVEVVYPNCLTFGKRGFVSGFQNNKIELSFDGGWIGFYLPNEIKKVNSLPILEHQAFKNCGGKLICSLLGGSHLYGLNTPESDEDYRGLFVAQNKRYLAGLDKIESIVQDGETDATYYEIARYLQLLRKSNTQVLEICFAPESSFVYKHPIFDDIVNNRYSLFDTDVLKNSLKGYVYSEIRLATGERSGQLGGKRKKAVEAYGFSPKNFVQILRLCKVGIEFFKTGQYMVNVKEFDQEYWEMLMDIKTKPQSYTCEGLKEMVDRKFEELVETMDNSTIRFKFDVDLAADIILKAKNI